MAEKSIPPEFERIKDKFGNIHKELSQIVDEARNKIEVQIDGQLSITIRNAAIDQDIITAEDRARFTHFISKFQQLPEMTTVDLVERNGKIFIENEDNVILNDLFSGAAAFDEFSTLVMAVNYFLMSNKEKNIKIQKMDFEISGREVIKKAELENVLIDKNAYLPQEPIAIRMFLKNEKGDNFEEQVSIKTPSLKPGAVFYLMAADAMEVTEFDTKFIKTAYFPTKLNALIRAINNIRKNNRIYLKIFVPSKGIFINGFEYPYLPSSVSNVLLYNSLSKDQANVQISTVAEYQFEVPAVVSGKKIFKLTIKERKNES